ncbi:MAG: SPFH domain-containing protein, partial [Clostridia bacterium]|nr:SPFH domain-containing protein [Clostridia bacterium]
GEFTYDTSTEPSIFSGKLGDTIKETFKTVGKRFTYGGDTGKDQRVYYFNTKEIMDNKFGTPNPFMFEVANKRLNLYRSVQVRCNGVYSYRITDPLLFYTKLAGNVSDEYRREEIDNQLKTEFISALQPAFAMLTELELRPAQIPAHTTELKNALNQALQVDWTQRRGISVESIALNPITLTPEDMQKINQMEDAATMGSNPFMMAGRMTDAQANAMEAAAANEGGAMNGFMGFNMAMGANGGFNAQQMYQAGMQQQQQMAQQQTAPVTPAQPAPAAPVQGGWKCACGTVTTGNFCPECGSSKPAEGWTCSCGAVNKGKFCPNCGQKKPEGNPVYQCNKCGWKPENPNNLPKFCPECGDIFNEADKQ